MNLALPVLVAIIATYRASQDRFPEVIAPLAQGGQAVRRVVDDLIRRKVVFVIPVCDRRPSGTRYEDAVVLNAAYQVFIYDPKVKRRLGVDYPEVVRSVLRASLLREKELTSMGVDVEGMKLHLGALARGEGFPDVPPTHWASKATRELKDRGLLKGDPDGLFRGNGLTD